MDRLFKSKWFVRILALVLSIMLYSFVSVDEADKSQDENSIFSSSSNDELQTIEDVPVQIRMDNEKYVVSGVPEYVDVSLEGKTSAITPLIRQLNFEVFVDLETLGEGEHTVEVQYENIPEDISVYIEPKTVDVVIEERATQEFPVTVDLINTNEMPDGFQIGDPVVEPSTVAITSSKSVVEEIAVVKAFVDVSEVTESIENREVPVNVYDGQGNELRAKVEPENIEVSVPVDNPSKSVPISVATTGDLPDGLSLKSIEPDEEEIEIFANDDILEELDEIQTEEVDLSEIEESGTMETELALPDGASISEEKVTIDIEVEEETKKTEETKTIEDIPIDIENGDEEQDISFVEPSDQMMSLEVTGSDEDIEDLTSDDFQAEIDIEGLEEGEHTVPVTVTPPDDVEIEVDVEDVVIEL